MYLEGKYVTNTQNDIQSKYVTFNNKCVGLVSTIQNKCLEYKNKQIYLLHFLSYFMMEITKYRKENRVYGMSILSKMDTLYRQCRPT